MKADVIEKITLDMYENWISEAEGLGCKTPDEFEEYILNSKNVNIWEFDKIREKIVRKCFNDKDYSKLNLIGNYFFGRTFIPSRLADDIMNNFIFLTTAKDLEMFVYSDGVYKPEGENLIREVVTAILGEDGRVLRTHEVISNIKFRTLIKRDEFDKDKDVINLKNGIFRLSDGKLHDHTPTILTTVQMGIKFDRKAKCPNIKKFLKEIVTSDNVPLLEEMIGYCLVKNYKFHRFFILDGETNAGKTTFIRLLESFLGKENVSGTSLYDLTMRTFLRAELYGKLANIHDDIPDTTITKTGAIKMVTGEAMIQAELKYRNPFKFTNYAKFIFTTNNPPNDSRKFVGDG
jgi:phage/plasmid primase, P4 family, C-terminal domain